MPMSDFEVVRSDVEGWDVRRTGEKQALSNYRDPRARRRGGPQGSRRPSIGAGGTADAIDVRQDVFSEGPEEDLDVKKTILGVSAVLVGVILLIAVVAILIVVTGVTNGS